jgi:predicted DNA binding CopG/RHH family protein
MKKTEIDYSDIPKNWRQNYKKGRHFTDEERAKFADAYRNTFHKEPPRVGRPFKYENLKLKPISIRLHPHVIRWAKKKAQEKSMGYQSFLNDFLMRHAA